jgi:hypothetical protein
MNRQRAASAKVMLANGSSLPPEVRDGGARVRAQKTLSGAS